MKVVIFHVKADQIELAKKRLEYLEKHFHKPDELLRRILGRLAPTKSEDLTTERFIKCLERYLREPEIIKYHRADYVITHADRLSEWVHELILDAELKAIKYIGHAVELLKWELVPDYEFDPAGSKTHWLFKDLLAS